MHDYENSSFPILGQIKAYANIFAVPRLEQCNF